MKKTDEAAKPDGSVREPHQGQSKAKNGGVRPAAKSSAQGAIDASLARLKLKTNMVSVTPQKTLKSGKEEISQLSLELWPNAVRGVSNPILRGALFGVSNERSSHTKRTLIASLDGYQIRYLGTTLNQTDLDVWEMLLHLARHQPLDTEVEFSAHQLLKELGRATGGKNHEELKEEIARLAAGLAEITWEKEKKTFAGTLISSFFRNEQTGQYVVRFDKDMAKLYEMGHTQIDWQQRRALGRNNLAKWLHGFYGSHAGPFAYKVETLHTICGSTSPLYEFRRMLRKALGALVQVGSLESWEIDRKTDLLKVKQTLNGTKRRHLSRKSKLAKGAAGTGKHT